MIMLMGILILTFSPIDQNTIGFFLIVNYSVDKFNLNSEIWDFLHFVRMTMVMTMPMRTLLSQAM